MPPLPPALLLGEGVPNETYFSSIEQRPSQIN